MSKSKKWLSEISFPTVYFLVYSIMESCISQIICDEEFSKYWNILKTAFTHFYVGCLLNSYESNALYFSVFF